MHIQQFNDAFTATLDLLGGLLVPAAIAYGGGLLYGTVCKIDKNLAARAFAISTLVYYAFQALAHFATEGENTNPKAFYATQLFGTDVLGIIQVFAYQKLNIVGSIGTAVMSTALLLGSIIYISKLGQAYSLDGSV